jgi:hypothetical protein
VALWVSCVHSGAKNRSGVITSHIRLYVDCIRLVIVIGSFTVKMKLLKNLKVFYQKVHMSFSLVSWIIFADTPWFPPNPRPFRTPTIAHAKTVPARSQKQEAECWPVESGRGMSNKQSSIRAPRIRPKPPCFYHAMLRKKVRG